MASKAKIEATWEADLFDRPVLRVRKKRGKLSLEEIEDFLRYSDSGAYQGDYVAILRAGESTCGGSGWMDEEEDPGDAADLYRIEPGEKCPVCKNETPYIQYCPECGADLIDPGRPGKQDTIRNAERVLEGMKQESLRMIREARTEACRKAWYQSHLGSIDFARQMGLISEERRAELYEEFKKGANREARQPETTEI